MPHHRTLGLLLASLFVAMPVQPAQARENPTPTAALVQTLERGEWGRASVAAARQALRRGADARARSRQGVTALMFAARSGDLPLMRAVLRAGVDINAQTLWGQTALGYVMASRDVERVRFLLDHGARIDLADTEGRTPLMMATHFKFREGIELLLRRGARVNARNARGHTVLAYTDSHPGITRLLRARGAVE